MKVTLKGNIPGDLASVTHDADLEPMTLHLTDEDRRCIAEMPKGRSLITFFPDNMSLQVAYGILGEKFENPAGPGLEGGRCSQILEALECGSLDSARAMLQEGLPPKAPPPEVNTIPAQSE